MNNDRTSVFWKAKWSRCQVGGWGPATPFYLQLISSSAWCSLFNVGPNKIWADWIWALLRWCFCILSQWDTAFITLENWNVNLWNPRGEKLDPCPPCVLYILHSAKFWAGVTNNAFKIFSKNILKAFFFVEINVEWKASEKKRREIYILSIFDVVFKAASILLGSFAQVLFWKNLAGKNFHARGLLVCLYTVCTCKGMYVCLCVAFLLQSDFGVSLTHTYHFSHFRAEIFTKWSRLLDDEGCRRWNPFFFVRLFEKVLLKLLIDMFLGYILCSVHLFFFFFLASAWLSRFIVV